MKTRSVNYFQPRTPDWKAARGPGEYAGKVEFRARWAQGYGATIVVDAGKVTK